MATVLRRSYVSRAVSLYGTHGSSLFTNFASIVPSTTHTKADELHLDSSIPSYARIGSRIHDTTALGPARPAFKESCSTSYRCISGPLPATSRTASAHSQQNEIRPRAFSTASQHPDPTGKCDKSGSSETKQREVLYKGKGIKVFRLLVRMKVAQLTGIVAAAIPITAYASEGFVPVTQLVLASGMFVGAGVVSMAIWYYSSRYIGEMSTIPGNRIVLSTMDFWGKRQDDVTHVRNVIPPFEGLSQDALKDFANMSLIPLNVRGDRQYFISLRHGQLVDKVKLMELLDGTWGARAASDASDDADQMHWRVNVGALPTLGVRKK